MGHPRISRKKTTYNKATRIIISGLLVLMAADTALTCIAVGYLGADELNPLYVQLGGLFNFITLKMTMSLLCIGGLSHLGVQYPNKIRACSAIICMMYAGAITWNILGLLGFRMM